jgi:transposase
MESTGVYWIPLYEILEERGGEVLLVNARHVKNVPGRRCPLLSPTRLRAAAHPQWPHAASE